MKKKDRTLVETVTLLTIVIALSSLGSMLVFAAGTFEELLPIYFNQTMVVLLSIASFGYMGYAMYIYHSRHT